MSNLESGIFYLLLSLKDLKELGKKGQEDSWKNGRLGREKVEYHFNTRMGKAIQLCASRLFPSRVGTTTFQRHV